MPGRIILTCGEPAGIGPELAPLALASGVDFAWMGDPRHLPDGTAWTQIAAPSDTVPDGHLPVLRHDFPALARPGRPDPANAAGVIAVIAQAVADAAAQGIEGKAVTPFLLGKVLDLTGGDSLKANVALVRSNARLAAEIAVALASQ